MWGGGCHTPPGTISVGTGSNLAFLSQMSKLVIYVGKMQKFSCLSAKGYASVQFACKLKTYRQNSFVIQCSGEARRKSMVDHVLLFLAHDCILTNILTEIYNSLLFYFVLFPVQHDVAHAHCTQHSLSTGCQKLRT